MAFPPHPDRRGGPAERRSSRFNNIVAHSDSKRSPGCSAGNPVVTPRIPTDEGARPNRPRMPVADRPSGTQQNHRSRDGGRDQQRSTRSAVATFVEAADGTGWRSFCYQYFHQDRRAWGDWCPRSNRDSRSARSPTRSFCPSSRRIESGRRNPWLAFNAYTGAEPSDADPEGSTPHSRASRFDRLCSVSCSPRRLPRVENRWLASDQGKPRPASARNLIAAPPRPPPRGGPTRPRARSFIALQQVWGDYREASDLLMACWANGVNRRAGRGLKPLSFLQRPRFAGPWRTIDTNPPPGEGLGECSLDFLLWAGSCLRRLRGRHESPETPAATKAV